MVRSRSGLVELIHGPKNAQMHLNKSYIIQAPILVLSNFGKTACSFVVYTDASRITVGAVLEQDSHVIGNASRALTKPEKTVKYTHTV